MQEYERRKAKDQARAQEHTQRIHSKLGDGIIGKIAVKIAVDDSPRTSTEVWAQGAIGEERVGMQLDALNQSGVLALHDRRIPKSRANIDHIAVTPWAVWVIDTKRYIGKRPDVYFEGSVLGIGGTPRLKVGGRNRDQLVEGALRQRNLVDTALSEGGFESVPVKAMLCFVEADWPLIAADFTVRKVRVCSPKRLAKELVSNTAPLIDVAEVHQFLGRRFPSH